MKTIAVLTVASLALLAGCKTYVGAQVFTTDIEMVANGDTLPADLTLALQLSSEEDCAKHGQAIADAYATVFREVALGACGKIEYETVLNLNVVTDFLPVGENPPVPAQPMALGARQTREGIEVLFLANPDASRTVWDALPEDLTNFQKFEVDTILTPVINNDSPLAVTFLVNNVFVDGIPKAGQSDVTLDRRDTASIALSDVANAAFGQSGDPVLIGTLLQD